MESGTFLKMSSCPGEMSRWEVHGCVPCSDSLCSVFIAGGLWCSTVNGLCSVSSPSSSCSETRFWPGDLSGWASARVADAFLCLCKRWKRIPSRVPWSDTLNMDISSCASFGHLKHSKKGKGQLISSDMATWNCASISCFETAVVYKCFFFLEFKCFPPRRPTRQRFVNRDWTW